MTTPEHHSSKFKFISNPFKSSFDGMSKLFKLNQTPAIIILVLSLFGGIFNSIGSFPGSDGSGSSSSATEALHPAIIAIIVMMVFIFLLIAIVLGVIYAGIVNYITWKTSRNETTTIGKAFEQTMKRFWRILGIQIIVGLKVFFGLLLFIVPGIRAALRYQMVYLAMFDEDLDITKSQERVKALTKHHLMEVFGIMTVSQLLFPMAIIIQMGGESILYPQLKYLKAHNLPKPQTHWLNYIGFLVFGVFMFLIGILVLLIALATAS